MLLPRLLLVGCGHAHLFVLEALARREISGVAATLISAADEYFYSGMVPGVIAGCYQPEDARLRPPGLARAAGAEWVRAYATRVDAQARRVWLADGRSVSYDLLSLDIGSRPAGLEEVPGAARYALPIKPMRTGLDVLPRAVEATERATRERPARVVVVGGGAAGIEVSVCLDAALTHRFGRDRHRFTVLEGGEQILPEYPDRFRELASGVLGRRSIEVRTGTRVEAVDPAAIRVTGGDPVPCDLLLWATGPSAPPPPRDSSLPTNRDGYLRVGPTLQAEGQPDLFGAGDCVALADHPWVPKAGVYAVRQGPVLARNLARRLRGDALEVYEPQRDWLSLMNTADGRALLAYRGISLHGRPAWWLKNFIDRRFVRRFQRLERWH